ncbi:MAG: PD-(D/E)XK nuclease family protein, partial [Fimbriimonadales bacterium]|nr:PD-(D/E)XK nuclease family protein [Fimbriimonadales bacterium]
MAVRCVPFGSEATRTLRSLIADAKASDPCAAVTVAVSSVPAAVQLRRALAEGGRPEGAGLFNVRVVTLSSLSRQLAEGAELCPGPARWALIRRLLEEDPGPLEACRDHPELPLALSRAFDAMAASDRPSGPLEPMWRRYREAIAGLGLADPPSLAERLPDRLPPDLGTVVVHLPKPPARSEEALLRKLERAGAVLVLGATGDERADAWLHRWCPSVPAVRPAVAETLLACTDAEEEVREAVRAVWRWAEQGVPLERCAILFRRRHPYARVAFDVLREARLPAYGRSPLQLWDSLVGLTVGVALEAAQGGFDADRLFDWLAAARPRTPEGEAASVEAWRRLVRELGVETNLPALLRWLGKRSGAEAASFLRFLEHWFDACRTLFASSSGEPWAARVRALLDWVDALVPDQSLPEPERRLKERWRAKVTELKSAAAAQPEVDGPGFAWQVRQTLRGDGRAPGRLGTGVFVGTFEEARGMDLDAVALVGLAEGVCPTIVRGDPILGLVPGALPPIAEQVDRERELYLAALATGAKARMATFPRVDRVDGSGFLPSRWIGDQLRSQGRGTEDYERAPSFERRVFEGGFASPQELLAASRPIGRSARWQERMQERESDQPGPHTGFVAPMPERLGSPISVTAAADLFACPQRFFLKDVLRVAETEAPREESSVDPRRLGSALHSALSGFLGALPAAEWPEAWQDAHKLRLQRLLEAELDRLEQAGWVRRPA